MTIYVGIDNTSNNESIGTAKFARRVANKISDKYPFTLFQDTSFMFIQK
jgi:hypothetical protein